MQTRHIINLDFSFLPNHPQFLDITLYKTKEPEEVGIKSETQ